MMTKPIVTIVMILSKLPHRCYERNFKQLRIEAWKSQDFNQRGLNPWPGDTGATL